MRLKKKYKKGKKHSFLRQWARRNLWRKAVFFKLFILFTLFSTLILVLKTEVQSHISDYLEKTLGFSLENIVIEGAQKTKRDTILKILKEKDNSLFSKSPELIRDKLEKINWVEKAVVRRIFPNKMIINLYEKKAIAFFKSSKTYYLIDEKGKLICKVPFNKKLKLPTVVGGNGAEKSPLILKTLKTFSQTSKQLVALEFINGYRWNIILNFNVVAKLPYDGLEEALTKLENFLKRKDIAFNTIHFIDLRIPDKIILRFHKITNNQKKI